MKMPNRRLLKKVYNCIKTYIEENGYAPSYAEINKITGISYGYISTIVNSLIMLGCLERPRDRIIRLTGKDFSTEQVYND